MSTGRAALPRRPEVLENIQVPAGANFDLPSVPLLAAALGWLALSTAIAYRFGWWLLPAAIGLGLLVAGLGVMLRDAVAGWALTYIQTLAEENAKK
jgi:hypothetical protein